MTSKFLSYILRHEPQSIGLRLDAEGWANIDLLIVGAVSSGHILDKRLIERLISVSDKKRFALSIDGQKIRAVQGHSSSEVNIRHVEKIPPEVLYHGTASRFLKSIFLKGLIQGARHYVHLSQDIQTAITVGRRYGEPVALKVESLRMHQQGYTFFQAENDVWLTEHVTASFIDKD